jgi:hypothetical protein
MVDVRVSRHRFEEVHYHYPGVLFKLVKEGERIRDVLDDVEGINRIE